MFVITWLICSQRCFQGRGLASVWGGSFISVLRDQHPAAALPLPICFHPHIRPGHHRYHSKCSLCDPTPHLTPHTSGPQWKISVPNLAGRCTDTRRMKRLLMQSMGTAQRLREGGKWGGISKCICILLICAVSGKQPLMKGMYPPLNPPLRWEGSALLSLWRAASHVNSWRRWNLGCSLRGEPLTPTGRGTRAKWLWSTFPRIPSSLQVPGALVGFVQLQTERPSTRVIKTQPRAPQGLTWQPLSNLCLSSKTPFELLCVMNYIWKWNLSFFSTHSLKVEGVDRMKHGLLLTRPRYCKSSQYGTFKLPPFHLKSSFHHFLIAKSENRRTFVVPWLAI